MATAELVGQHDLAGTHRVCGDPASEFESDTPLAMHLTAGTDDIEGHAGDLLTQALAALPA